VEISLHVQAVRSDDVWPRKKLRCHTHKKKYVYVITDDLLPSVYEIVRVAIESAGPCALDKQEGQELCFNYFLHLVLNTVSTWHFKKVTNKKNIANNQISDHLALGS
jgi:hypothetical protein